jgi:hypothetical protein
VECKAAQIGGGGVVVRDREQHRPALIGRTGGARDMGKTTRIGDGAAPVGQGMRGWVFGEVTGAGALGCLGERTSTECPPGVRRLVGLQSEGDSGQKEEDKGKRD